MYLKDLDIEIPYAPLMQSTVKVHHIFRLRECSSFYSLRCQYSVLKETAIVKKKNISYTKISFS